VRDAHAGDQLAELIVIDGGRLANDALAGGTGRGRRRHTVGRCRAAGPRGDRFAAAAPGEAEPQVVEQRRLAEPLAQVLEQLRAK
jgi:hypothetical protein